MFLLLLLTISIASGVLSSSFISPCKITDQACLEKSMNDAASKILVGVPELGIESSDPLFVEQIDGNLSILKYKFFNSTITGYKNCVVTNLKLSQDISSVQYDLNCPKINMKGQYEINGRLIILPVEGSGDFELITGKYLINVQAELKKVEGSDGKTHLAIKNFKLKCKPLSPNKYDFKNLFNGQKDLSDAVHKFAHESWQEVAELVQEPTWYISMKKVISNVNKYLKTVPLEDILLN